MGRTSLTPDSSANQRRRVGPLISSAMPLAPIASPAACVPRPPPHAGDCKNVPLCRVAPHCLPSSAVTPHSIPFLRHDALGRWC